MIINKVALLTNKLATKGSDSKNCKQTGFPCKSKHAPTLASTNTNGAHIAVPYISAIGVLRYGTG